MADGTTSARRDPEDAALARADRTARLAIVRAGRRLHARGLLAGTEGNLSVRLPDGTLVATPSGADKATLRPRQLLRLRADGSLHHTAARIVTR